MYVPGGYCHSCLAASLYTWSDRGNLLQVVNWHIAFRCSGYHRYFSGVYMFVYMLMTCANGTTVFTALCSLILPACLSVRPVLTTPCPIQNRNCQLFSSCLSGFCFVFLFRPHRSTTYLDAACCYRRSSVVCRSVCRSVCHRSEACKKG